MKRPPVCDLRANGCCAGEVTVYPCSKGCGYVVRRCKAHGGRSLGGAIGGHARSCRAGMITPFGGVAGYVAGVVFVCKTCGKVVRLANLHAHLLDVHGTCCKVFDVATHYRQETR